ncbi:hypothetical protein F441_18367 [Phytophthora nicotianae CJ01A1]|uniref:RxLR effector protein n=3 Tax=Phytophthora nicotianae TaxID=4792 RepID=W2W3G6_PHYNI|nr:hypothetical protein F441_18367 [Phytophthora nicotianae CJ01A1]
MRVQCLAVVAALSFVSSANGLHVVPNSAKSASLRAPAEARYQPYVEGKTDRFLVSESKNDVATEDSTKYAFSTLKDDNDMLQDDDQDEDEDESETEGNEGEERFSFKRRKKKKKKKKHKETPTPTPALNSTATPTPTPTPSPGRIDRLVSWFDRRFD